MSARAVAGGDWDWCKRLHDDLVAMGVPVVILGMEGHYKVYKLERRVTERTKAEQLAVSWICQGNDEDDWVDPSRIRAFVGGLETLLAEARKLAGPVGCPRCEDDTRLVALSDLEAFVGAPKDESHE